MAKLHGHKVLRVPPYQCELNASEIIWAQIKGGVGRRITSFNITVVTELLEEELKKLHQKIGAKQFSMSTNWNNLVLTRNSK